MASEFEPTGLTDAPLPPSTPPDAPTVLPEFSDDDLARYSQQQLNLLDQTKPEPPTTGEKVDAAKAIPKPTEAHPSLLERTQLHVRSSFWTGTTLGPVLYKGVQTLAANDIEFAKTYKDWIDNELLKYDLMPDANSTSEYASAILGGFLGGVPDPINLIALGGGTAATAVGRTVQAGTKLGGLSFAVDAPRQAMLKWDGLQREWDWQQSVLAFPQGMLMGMGIHAIGIEAPNAILHALRATRDAAADDAARIVMHGLGLPSEGGNKPRAAFLEEWRPTTQSAEMTLPGEHLPPAQQRMLQIASEMETLGPDAAGFAKGLRVGLKFGDVKPEMLQFAEEKLASFRGRGGAAADKPQETITLPSYLKKQHQDQIAYGIKGEPLPAEIISVIQDASDVFTGAIRTINEQGLKHADVNSHTAPVGSPASEAKKLAGSLAGQVARLLNGITHTKRDYGSKRVQDDLATLRQDIADARAARKPTTEATPAGQQTVLPGAERIGMGEQAQRAADRPLQGEVPQKEAGGLFGESSKQTDLLDQIPKPTPAPLSKEPPPQTLTQYLNSVGGMKDTPELTTIFGKAKRVKLQKGKMTATEAYEAAIEGGYIQREGEGEAAVSSGLKKLHDMIDEEARGRPQFPLGATPRAGRDMQMEAAAHEVTVAAQEGGMGNTPHDRAIQERAIELVYTKGKDATDALDQASAELGPGNATRSAVDKTYATVAKQLEEGDVFFMPAEAPIRGVMHAAEPEVPGAALSVGHPGGVTRPAAGIPDVPGLPTLPPGAASIRKIITDLADALDVTLGQGHVKVGALGHYDMRQMAARAKNTHDIEVVTHEIGHHLDAMLGKPLRNIIRSHEQEMRGLVPSAYANSIDRVWKQEGLAEFLRTYVTNRNFALQKAPRFAAEFRTFMEANHPDTLAAIDAANTAFVAFNKVPSGAVTRDFVVSWAPPRRELNNEGLSASITVRLHDMYDAVFDQVHPLTKITRNLLGLIKEKTGKAVDLPAEQDPAVLMRVALQPQSIWVRALKDGMRGYHSTAIESGTIPEAMVLMGGKANLWGRWEDDVAKDFGVGLVAREALYRHSQFENGDIPNAPTGNITRGDWEVALAEIRAKYPQFDQAAAIMDGIRQSMWRKRFHAGQTTKELYEAGLKNPHHVPFWRDFSEDTNVLQRLGIKTSLEHDAVKAFKGSSRPILDPLQSILKEMADLESFIAKNDVMLALRNLARLAGRPTGKQEAAQAAAGGKFIEEIRNSDIKPTARVVLDDMLDRVGRQQGLSVDEIAAAKANLAEFMSTDTAIQFFGHTPVKPGKEAIAFGWEGGERFTLKFNDVENSKDVVRLMAMANDVQRDTFLRGLGLVSQVMRAGTVTDPTFVLGNVIRDTMSAWVLHGGIPGAPTVSGFMSYLRNDERAQLFEAVGGRVGGVLTQQLRDLQMTRDFQKLAADGRLVARFSSFGRLWENITRLSEVSETATRLGVFSKYYQRNLDAGLDKYTAAFRAMHEAVDTLDFSMHGSKTNTVITLVPFLNANLQGISKLTRASVAPWVKAMTGNVLTTQEQAAVGQSGMVAARIGMIAVASVALRALYADDPEYEEISDYLRSTHWMVKLPWLNGGTVYNAFGQQVEVPKDATGVWVAIPKPFDMALIPNAAERAFEALYLKDPTAAKRWAKGALTITSPPNPLSDVPLLKNIAEIKSGHDFFTSQPIVPDYLKGLEPEHQYTARTPEIAKGVAKALNKVWPGQDWSPLEVEHLIAGFTSTWGRDLMALFDVAAGKEKGWQDWPFTRRYMREVTRGSVSNLAYWDLISNGNGRLENAAKTYKTFLDNNRPIEAADHFAKLDAAQKAYVALKNGDHFGADDKKLHPLIRAQEAMQALTGMRRQVANNNVVSAFGDREDIKLTGSQQKMLDQELAMLAMIEARNALIVAKEPGWEQKQIVKPDATYDVIRQISPDIADELASRYAARKIYKFDAAAQAWPQVLAQMKSEGTDTSLAEYRSDVRSAGFEMDGYKRRKARLPRASISAEEMTRAPQ